MAALVEGGYAEYVLADPHLIIPIPETLDFVHAAAFPLQGVTAYQLLHECAHLQPGESVLVHAAAGGVGTLAVQLAHLMGAGNVLLAGEMRTIGAGVVSAYYDHTRTLRRPPWPVKEAISSSPDILKNERGALSYADSFVETQKGRNNG